MKLHPALLLLCALSGYATAQAPVELCFDENPPYTLDRRAPHGIKVELARAAFGQLGLAVHVRLLPFARCLKMVELGQVDGALPLSMNAERKSYMQFSRPVFLQTMAFVYRKMRFPNGLHWNNFEELKQYKLVINLGSIIDRQMEVTFEAQHHLQRVNDANAMLRMVAAGRVELAALDRTVAAHVIRSSGLATELAISEQPINASPAYFGISRKSPLLQRVPELNLAIEKLHNSGELERIATREY